ncbi:xanthine dehydrogenase family protein molybdopterin-binding subunit [Salipiger sp. P9]|uniref:xanthine dehydrogenase family protein molybdopterin-binding subunit n=1 Tax=Salipiger pentaromativorans TaxID=2943193 RepID=UPI0021583D23|nr:xanthine dehydrogenase family protein molybdopterin-binding subunit [Salipiger pentaromativorans]
MKDDSQPADYRWVGKRLDRPDGADKVTGRARFGADIHLPGELVGKCLLSPHPHARILRIDTGKARALPGVKAVVTGADFPVLEDRPTPVADYAFNLWDQARTLMARDKVLFDGHPVAAVAATTEDVAQQALALIEVAYEILPHVTDLEAAMAPDAPLLHETMITTGVAPGPAAPSNIVARTMLERGNIDAGFEAADIVVEREFRSKPVHQGYIEPHACIASVAEDGRAELWTCTQGPWIDRAFCAGILGWEMSDLKVVATEIGGGFGGKLTVYDEPIALRLSQLTRKPVRMVMTRSEVLRRTGPTSGSLYRVRLGAKSDGTLVAADCEMILETGAFPGSPLGTARAIAFTHLDIPNLRLSSAEVVSNRPSVQAYRAPGGPITCYAQESVMDEMAEKLGISPFALIRKNAVREGTVSLAGFPLENLGLAQVLDAAEALEHLKTPLGPTQGRGIATSYWKNGGGQTSVSAILNEDGTVNVGIGTPDIGGLRASVSMMVAETMGVPYDKVTTTIADTSQLGFNSFTAGSRTAYAVGLAVVGASKDLIAQVCERAAKMWDLPPEAVDYADGMLRPAGPNAGAHDPVPLATIAAGFAKSGGPIMGKFTTDGPGAGPNFATHIADVEVDPETGGVTVLRYSIVVDVGRAIHPDYVEGQNQGGAAQGIGWALNEEYVYGADGRLQNTGFLDYRMPVAPDLPMIGCTLVEVPNPNHPFGVRGVGEVSIVPSVAAVANAVKDATGLRFFEIPMSPPRVLARIAGARAAKDPSLKPAFR